MEIGDWVRTKRVTGEGRRIGILPNKPYRVVKVGRGEFFNIHLSKACPCWGCKQTQDYYLPENVEWEVMSYEKNLQKILK